MKIGVYGSYIMATFMLGWTLGAILFGLMADKLGRTKTLIITVLLYAICTGLCAISHSWIELAVYRFLVGVGIGGEISIGGVMLAESWSGKSRLYATGILQTGFSVGYLILGVANLVIGDYGWRWLYVLGIVPAFLALYMRLSLKDSSDAIEVREARKKLEEENKENLTEHDRNLLTLPIVELFTNKENRNKVLVLVTLSSAVCIGTYAVISWVPAWINQLTGHAAVQERSWAVIARNIGAILGAGSAGFFVLKFGRRWSFRIAFIGALIGSLTMFLTVKSFGPHLVGYAAIEGFFVLAPYAYLFIYVPELFDTRLRATAFGFCIQCGRTFAAIACVVGGQLVAFFGGSFALAGACVSLVYIIGLIATFFMPESSGEVSAELINSEAKTVSN